MSCFLLILVWMITYCMFQEIHHQTLCLHQRHQSLFSDHVSCPQRPSHKQSETKQSEMKYPMFEVWTKNHKPIKIFTSNTSFHIGFTVLSFVFVRNVLAPTGNRKKYHHRLKLWKNSQIDLWYTWDIHWHSETMILSQWINLSMGERQMRNQTNY